MIAAESACMFIAVMAKSLGPRASLRQAEMLLMVAMREPVDRRAIGETRVGSGKALFEDLHRLCAVDRDGERGLDLIAPQPKPRDYRSVQYVLTARGRRAARQIATAAEALLDASCVEVAQMEADQNDLLRGRPVEIKEAPVKVTSVRPSYVETDDPGEAIKPLPRTRAQTSPRPWRRIADAGRTSRLPNFKYKGNPIRAVQSEGMVWFIAGDICKCLGRDTSAGAAKALRYIRPDDRCVLVHTALPAGFLGERRYEASGVSLSGFLMLIQRTKGTASKAFEEWVRERVIPQLPVDSTQ
jgi:hypothetical protein